MQFNTWITLHSTALSFVETKNTTHWERRFFIFIYTHICICVYIHTCSTISCGNQLRPVCAPGGTITLSFSSQTWKCHHGCVQNQNPLLWDKLNSLGVFTFLHQCFYWKKFPHNLTPPSAGASDPHFGNLTKIPKVASITARKRIFFVNLRWCKPSISCQHVCIGPVVWRFAHHSWNPTLEGFGVTQGSLVIQPPNAPHFP